MNKGNFIMVLVCHELVVKMSIMTFMEVLLPGISLLPGRIMSRLIVSFIACSFAQLAMCISLLSRSFLLIFTFFSYTSCECESEYLRPVEGFRFIKF